MTTPPHSANSPARQPQGPATPQQLSRPEPIHPALPPSDGPQSELVTSEEEDELQLRREFYAWCSGCEGYDSIF